MRNMRTKIALLMGALMCTTVAIASPQITRQEIFDFPYKPTAFEYQFSDQGNVLLELVANSADPLSVGELFSYQLTTPSAPQPKSKPVGLDNFRGSIELSNGRRAIAMHNGDLVVYNFRTNQIVMSAVGVLAMGYSNVEKFSLAASQDQKTLYVFGQYQNQILAFDLETLALKANWTFTTPGHVFQTLTAIKEITFQNRPILVLSISIEDDDDGAADPNGLLYFDPTTARVVKSVYGKDLGLKREMNYNNDPIASPNGELSIFCQNTKGCFLLNMATNTRSNYFCKDGGRNGSFAFSPDSKFVYSYDGTETRVLRVNSTGTKPKFAQVSKVSVSETSGFEATPRFLPKSQTIFVAGFDRNYLIGLNGKILSAMDCGNEFFKDSVVHLDQVGMVTLRNICSGNFVEQVTIKL
jgi:hypothetical protein